MENRAVRIGVFVGAFVCCLLLATRCTLPNAFMARVAEAQLEKGLDYEYEVSIERARLRGLVGAGLENLQLTSRNHSLPSGAPVRIRVPKATLGVSPLNLVGQNVDAKLKANVGGGRVELDVFRKLSSNEQNYEIRLYDVDMAAFPFVEGRIGLPLSGVLRGTITVGFDPEGRLASGNVDLNVLNTKLGPGSLPNSILPPDVRRFWSADIAFPQVDIGDILLRAPVNGSEAKIETLRVVGEDLRASGEGRVILREPLGNSQIQASVRLAIEQAFIEEADLGGLIGSIPELRGMNRGGEMLFTLSGPVKRPQLSSRSGGGQ
jgi:type II secretion system protein N